MKRFSKSLSVALLFLLMSLASCNSTGAITSIHGTVTVDDLPAEMGTVHFRPSSDPSAKGAGGVITNGSFSVEDSRGLPLGKYLVTIQASRKTGRLIKDQQRGSVAEMASLSLQQPTQEIDLTTDTASNLTLNFHSKGS